MSPRKKDWYQFEPRPSPVPSPDVVVDNGRLPTLAEAADLYLTRKDRRTPRRVLTCTPAVYFLDNNGRGDVSAFVAIDHSAGEHNIILARQPEGIVAHEKYGRWPLPKTDAQVRRVIETCDVLELPEEIPSSLENQAKNSEFERDPWAKILLGNRLGEVAAAFREHGYKDIGLSRLNRHLLAGLLRLDKDSAEVRRVCFGEEYSMGRINADYHLHIRSYGDLFHLPR